jgi:hypothetical protein
MWKPEHRRAADRSGRRYPSDLTDAGLAIIEPMIPPAKRDARSICARYRTGFSISCGQAANGRLCPKWFVALCVQQTADAMPLQAAMQRRSREMWDSGLES